MLGTLYPRTPSLPHPDSLLPTFSPALPWTAAPLPRPPGLDKKTHRTPNVHLKWSKVLQKTTDILLFQLMTQSRKERYEVCWAIFPEMTGHALFSEVHHECWERTHTNLRAIQGHSGERLDISTPSRKRFKRCTRSTCTISVWPEMMSQQHLYDLYKEDLDNPK